MNTITIAKGRNKMKVEKIKSEDIFEDNNHGLSYGIQEASNSIGYIEWFKSEKEREKCIKENNFEVIN